jgi:hypothetical protein
MRANVFGTIPPGLKCTPARAVCAPVSTTNGAACGPHTIAQPTEPTVLAVSGVEHRVAERDDDFGRAGR